MKKLLVPVIASILILGTLGLSQDAFSGLPPGSPTIKITKLTIGGDGSFNFTIFNATNPANSTALNIPDTSINNMTAPLTVQAASFSVIETVPLNWNLISSDCLINGIPHGSTLNFNLINGDTVECIFVNLFVPPPSPPTIKITKDTTNGDGSFNFTIFNATNPANSTALNIPDTSINNMTAPLTVQAASFSVIETVPLNWNLISSDCLINGIPHGSTLNFNLINGDTVECIFENLFVPPPSPPETAVGGEMFPVDTTALLLAATYSTASWMIPLMIAAVGFGILITHQKTKLKHNSCPSCKLESDDIFKLGNKTVGKCDNPKCRVSLFYKK